MRNTLSLFSCLALLLSLTHFSIVPLTNAAGGTVVVSPGNMNGWGFLAEAANGTGSLVNGPATPPYGNGSARFLIDSTGSEYFAMGSTGILLSNFTKLMYSTYRSTGASALAVSLQLNIDEDITDGNNAWKGRLVFEPYYDNAVATGAWETWDALAGRWWASGAPINGICPQGAPCSIATILSTYPNAGVHPTLGAIGFKAGSAWAGGFDGNVDGLIVGVGGMETTYDFELDTPVPPMCQTGVFFQIGDIEGAQLDNPVDEAPFNWPGAFGTFPAFDDPFAVGISDEFPYNSNFGNGYATDFDITFNYDGPETATAMLHLGWGPGGSGAEQKEVFHNAGSIGTTPVRNGASVGGWWNNFERFTDSFPLVMTPGAQTINLKQLSGNGTVWDYVQLEITQCGAGSSSSSESSESSSESSSSESSEPSSESSEGSSESSESSESSSESSSSSSESSQSSSSSSEDDEGPLCNGLVPTIIGTPGNDLINGTNGDDVILARGGNDLINGKNGNDTICAGPGDDLINGNNGNDWISGGGGKDLINGNNGNDTLSGGPGKDLINGHNGNDTILGGGDDDLLKGHGGNDDINGGPGTDLCQGNGGANTIVNCE